MSSRALTFGSVAAAYERHRPGYPDVLVDEVLAYAGRPVATALEIGAGTGKATRVFAARGVQVTATEPDAEMLTELRRQVPGVATVRAAFEELPLTTTYDLVYAAAALHWTRPEGPWERMAALLEPGGVMASFGSPRDLADPELEEAVRAARAPWLADDDVPPPDGTPEQRSTVSARDYVGLLSTVSAYLELEPADREAELDSVLAVLPAQVHVVGDIRLHLARRA